jgi:hypothetical protein
MQSYRPGITPAPKRTKDLNSFLTPYNQLPNICDILWSFAKFNSMRATLQTDRTKRQSHAYPKCTSILLDLHGLHMVLQKAYVDLKAVW